MLEFFAQFDADWQAMSTLSQVMLFLAWAGMLVTWGHILDSLDAWR